MTERLGFSRLGALFPLPPGEGGFHRRFSGRPRGEAGLPVLPPFPLGIYSWGRWMLPGGVVLGIGHTGIHLGYRREAPV
ncbi:MAG: hypothetical protein HFG05_08045 [Oscillibacter sp.]|nr:hypothetical protein [Oscillibacter sp.]